MEEETQSPRIVTGTLAVIPPVGEDLPIAPPPS